MPPRSRISFQRSLAVLNGGCGPRLAIAHCARHGVRALQALEPLVSEYDIDTTPILDAAPLDRQATGDKLVDQPGCPAA
jgi:hypothetical protein